MKDMTIKELSTLTMKDIKAYVLIRKPGTKAPKKWQDKTKCLAWAEKTLDSNVELKKSTVKPGSKIPKPKAKKVDNRNGGAHVTGKVRRHSIVSSLRAEPMTADELARDNGSKYKSVLDDVHAIRHERASEVYLKDGEVLSDARLGKTKVFFVCKKDAIEAKKKSILKSIELA